MIKFKYINISGKTLYKELPESQFQTFIDKHAVAYSIIN